MKKIHFKFTSLLLVAMMIFMAVPVRANEQKDALDSAIDLLRSSHISEFAAEIPTLSGCLAQRLDSVFNGFDSHGASLSERGIGNIKQLSDFNGYVYYIVEFEPTGYIIFDNQFTTALVVNAYSASPYLSHYDNLIFAGAQQYYVLSGQRVNGKYIFTHTVLDTEMIVGYDELLVLQEQSRIISMAVEQTAETALLHSAIDNQMNSSAPSLIFLNNWQTIRNVNTSNFNQTDNCGYVAASLVVYYYFRHKGFNQLVHSQHLTNGVLNRNLSLGIQGTNSPVTVGPEVALALSRWSSNNGAQSLPGGFTMLPSSSTIFGLINQDRPLILLGNMPDPSGSGKMLHAVTVFGVFWETTFNYHYAVHYGWGPSHNYEWIHSSISQLLKAFAVYY
jgi:hypothetical protein